MRNLILFSILCFILLNIIINEKPVPVELNQLSYGVQKDIDYGDYQIDLFKAPYQEGISSKDRESIKLGYEDFIAQPLANYELSAMVMSKKKYSYGWESKVAPLDLALAWGDLVTPEARKHVSYSQRHRWYYFRYDGSSPVSKSYIYQHSANNHIVPANKNILSAVSTLKAGDTAFLKGYLVKINGTINGRDYWWNTSLSRTDTGDGACELFYVDLVKIGDNIYR